MNRASLKIAIFFLNISVCQGQFASPYKVYSPNEQHFVKSVPYWEQFYTNLGRTCIYHVSDTTVPITVFERYFSSHLFLSNDGQGLFHLSNWLPWVRDKKVLTFYKGGHAVQTYNLNDFLLSDTSRVYSLLYNSVIDVNGEDMVEGFRYPKVNRKTNFLQAGDTLTLFTHNERVFYFSMIDGQIISSETFEEYFEVHEVKKANRREEEYPIKKIPTQYGLPKLANGMEFWEGLEMIPELPIIFDEGRNEDRKGKYKRHYFEIDCAIDSAGNCVEVSLSLEDSVYKKSIIKFFKSTKFDKKEIPPGIEKWYFNYSTGFRNKSRSVAMKERQQEIIEEKVEYQKNLLRDSIDHVYIPANLEECFVELSKVLLYTDRKEFSEKGENELGSYHFDFGRWIRNDWGLWSGSRLSKYFNDHGVTHPEEMSSIVLLSYHRHLSGKDIKLEDQLKR